MATVASTAFVASTSNAANYSVGARTSPSSRNTLAVALVVASGTVSAATMTDTASGGTWTRVESATKAAGADTIYCFVRNSLFVGATTYSALFNNAGDNATGALIQILHVEGMHRAGASAVVQSVVRQDQATSTTPVFGLATSASSANVLISVIGNATVTNTGLNAPTNFTETGDSTYSTPTTSAQVTARASGHTTATVGWATASGSAWGGILLELNASAVTGSLARTNANDTSVGTGEQTQPVSGTLATTNANDSVAASGLETATGTLATTNANDTSAATGSQSNDITGTLATTNANDTLAATGLKSLSGTLATTNANDTLAATGLESLSGTLARTNANDHTQGGAAGGPTDFTAEYDANTATVTGTDIETMPDGTATLNLTVPSTNNPQRDGSAGSYRAQFVEASENYIESASHPQSLYTTSWSFVFKARVTALPTRDETNTNPDTANAIVAGVGNRYAGALYVRENAGNVEIGAGGANSAFGNGMLYTTGPAVDADFWITGTYDGATDELRVRLNKGTAATSTVELLNYATNDGLGTLRIGCGPTAGGGYFGGWVYYGRVFNRAISDAESDATQDELDGAGGGADQALGLETMLGTVARTNANDTSAASGSSGDDSVTGTSATTNANDTSVGAALETSTGTSATTNANDTSVGAALERFVGTLATTNANDALAATGLETASGTLATTNANDSVVATGRETFTGTLA